MLALSAVAMLAIGGGVGLFDHEKRNLTCASPAKNPSPSKQDAPVTEDLDSTARKVLQT